uniref:NADH-ubiquinone oxidoreductase chain 6 n=1 Tax=Staphylinidae sp. BMNH 1274190 TaxID=1796555 RepID=A0A140EG81_9COLE|nr:NADH dehydrogenase subunit 6 [Staphylinidae sp. BMNH 1274190]
MLCMTLMIMLIILSLLTPMLNHPMSLGLNLLIQTINISMITGIMNKTFWYSYVLFLIMIGGMIVLFIYMTSIASNEMFKFSNKIFIMMLMSMFIMFMLMTMFKLNLTFNMNSMNSLYPYMFELSLNKFFNYPSNLIMTLMIIYLFITLIAVVKITNIKMGPLRQKF